MQNSCVLMPPCGSSQSWTPGARLALSGTSQWRAGSGLGCLSHSRLGKEGEEGRCLNNLHCPPASRQRNAKHLVSLEREKEKYYSS